jgi:hypothetical protein
LLSRYDRILFLRAITSSTVMFVSPFGGLPALGLSRE